MKHAELGDGGRALHRLPFGVDDQLSFGGGGIGDRYVEAAKVVDRGLEQASDRLAITDVSLPDHRLAPHLPDSLRHFFGLVRMGAIVDDNVGTLFGQAQGYAAPDAA